MKILGIDPGVLWTGVALVDLEEEKLLLIETIFAEDRKKRLTQLLNFKQYRPDKVIIELYAPKGDHFQFKIVMETIEAAAKARGAKAVVQYSPAQYKQMASVLRWRHPAARNQHEADAYNLIYYWVRREREEDLGYLEYAQKE